MRVEYVSPFAEAANRVLESVVGLRPTRGQLQAMPDIVTMQQVNVVLGITGQVEGMVLYGMSVVTADRIAGLMMGKAVVTFDQMAASAVAELGNMISGNALTLLSKHGFRCDITPPTVIRGKNVDMMSMSGTPLINIPLILGQHGEVTIGVSLRERLAA